MLVLHLIWCVQGKMGAKKFLGKDAPDFDFRMVRKDLAIGVELSIGGEKGWSIGLTDFYNSSITKRSKFSTGVYNFLSTCALQCVVFRPTSCAIFWY